MGCENCEVKAEIDGRSLQVRLWIDQLNQVGTNQTENSVIYQCPQCQTFWEVFAYQKSVKERNPEEAKNIFPIIH
jgi:hypothetical protein